MIAAAIRSPSVAAPAPGPTPTPADKEPQAGSAAHPFAEVLRQNRRAEGPPAAEATKASTPADAGDRPTAVNGDDGAEPAPPGLPSSQRDAIQSKTRFAGASRAPARSTAVAAPSTAAADGAADTRDDRAAPAATASTDTVTAANAMAATRSDAVAGERASAADLGMRAAIAATRGRDGAEGQPSASASLAGQTPADAAPSALESRRGTLAGAADAADAAAERQSSMTGSEERVSASPSFAEALADSRTQRHSTTSSSPIDSTNPGAAAATTALAEPARNAPPGADAAVTTSTVPVPIDSPEFAAAFGLQVSTLARDGVQHAELHLNPTDMGPVSIQITLDGTQARVDFGADMAATRQAIETGLPELASALRDAGFTLAGGGVTQHSQSNGSQADDASSARQGSRRSAPEAIVRLDAAAQRVARRVAAGGVDLYA